ncbi:MAG: flippase [Candidatus Bathyarchaeia archaeon]
MDVGSEHENDKRIPFQTQRGGRWPHLGEELSNIIEGYARGSLILLIGQTASTAVNAAGVILLARFLGAEGYGLVVLATIPVSLIALLSDLGVSAAMTRFIAHYRSEGRGEVWPIMKAGIIFNMSVGGILFISSFLLSSYIAEGVFHRPEVAGLIKVASTTLLSNSLLISCQSIFVGFDRMELHSLTSMVFSILKSTIAPILALSGYGVFGALVGNAASTAASGVISLSMVLKILRGSPRVASPGARGTIRMLLGFGYPLFLSSLLTGGISHLYNLLLAMSVEASIIGNYQAALNFSVLINLLTMPITTVLFPLFSRFDADDAALIILFRASVKYSALLIVPATLGLILVSDQLVGIVYGGSFQLAPFFLRLYSLNFLFAGLGSVSIGSLLNGQGKTKVTFNTNLIYICIGMPMGLLLIPRMGVTGLLLTILFASKPGLFYALWWVRRNLGLTLDWAASAKIYLSSAIAYLIPLFILSNLDLSYWRGLFLGLITLPPVYSLLLTLTRALDEADIRALKIMVKAVGPLAPILRLLMILIDIPIRKKRSNQLGD